jgi:predicted RNA-binding Zn-ribbon protein involved in translation (DUF1610 family)
VTKAEMETDVEQYRSLLAKARSAVDGNDYRKAIEMALNSWQHIAGMLQYETKYAGKDFSSVETIDLVLEYAPLLLDGRALDGLEALLRSQRTIEKKTGNDLAANLAEARALMWAAYQFWDQMERQPEASANALDVPLGAESDRRRLVKEAWEKMGVVCRTESDSSHRLTFCTQLDSSAFGKCPSCGAVARAPKAKFLEMQTCPKCGLKESFVILSRKPKVD